MSALFSAAMMTAAFLVYGLVFETRRFSGVRWLLTIGVAICTFIVAYIEYLYGDIVLWGKRKEPRTPPRGFEVLPKAGETGEGERAKV